MVSTQVKTPGYHISEKLYDGARTIVYRGYRETDSLPVVIKVLKNPYPSFSELLQFRNQYTIGKNLNSPFIIQTYSLEVYQNGYALVMEDFGGLSLKEYFVSGDRQSILSIEEFLQVGIALCKALNVLYQQRIIHKDIKPSNILINPQTKQVKLIDFSIASLLPRETQTLVNPHVLEGTLAYISPEQTGRMNRGIDYRSDFYSLGVTLYELLTGQLPFVSNELMEVIHCHLAKTPTAVHEINCDIPLILSEIISKLMAKNAENRYQSALGIKHDLEICLQQFRKKGKVTFFPLGKEDISDHFSIPEKLYGREKEVFTLLEAFEKVSLGTSQIMLVSGSSGIGKTAVVNEIHKPIVRQRGCFIKGKYDQFQRDIPLSAFRQGFRDLIGQLLSEPDSQLTLWKTKILEAVGDNGQVLIDIIPELEYIIGSQPPASELSGTAAQNRFHLVLQKFVQVFTGKEHPLVIFLDDLQWVDSASLKLLQLLMQDTEYLLVICAYRDNEVSQTHPFSLTIDELIKTGAVVDRIALKSLSESDMNQLVADTLHCSFLVAQPLIKLVYQKTQGNPFFATQFLKALHDEQLITFNLEAHHWQCDLTQVKALAITSDIVEFMAQQLEKLPRQTQKVLKLTACIGTQFDLHTLAIVSEQSLEATAADLWKALQEGLIIPNTEIYKFFIQSDSTAIVSAAANPVYRFLHDRVQQAAYSLIPDAAKQATHLKIGQLLQQKSSEIEREEKLFDIVGHLNQGQVFIKQPQEREALAQLNFKAGAKARKATAYAAARLYFQTGIDLLEANCWQNQYQLTLNLYVAATEASYLNGDFEGMAQLAALALPQAQTIFDKVKIYEIQITAQAVQSKFVEALTVARDALGQLGIEFPTEVDEVKIDNTLHDLNQQLKGREILGLIDLPLMSEPTAQAGMQLLGMVFPAVSTTMPGLMPLLSATMVRLSLQFGNAPISTVGYAIHGMVLCAFLDEVETGYEFGRLALSLLERLNAQSMKCFTLSLFACRIQHRRQAISAAFSTFKESNRSGMETGDFFKASYAIPAYAFAVLIAGVDLSTLAPELSAYSAALAQVKQDLARIHLSLVQQTVQQLRETVIQPDCLIGTFYDETVTLPQQQQDKDLLGIGHLYIYKLLLAYGFGNYPAALDYISQAKSYLVALSGLLHIPIFHFYAALTYLALVPTQSGSGQVEILTNIETHQTTLYQWAQTAPMNHMHKWHLVEAEKCRVSGDKLAAIEQYEQAITLAKANKFLNEEALANELAAKFYLDWGKEKIAQTYMTEAYYCYAHWGAKAKVVDLETRYPLLLVTILPKQQPFLPLTKTISHISSSHTSLSEALDLASILKASQALSSEIELGKLLSTLLQVILENAGANKCALLMPSGGDDWVVEALAQPEQPPLILPSLPLADCKIVSVSLIHRVKNTLSLVVVENAVVEPTLASDPYILHHSPKSIVGAPILNRGQLIGILYLENNLTVGAFTQERLEILHLLMSQAAISLENARLYAELEKRVEERTHALNQKNEQLQSTLKELHSTQTQMVQNEKMAALGQLVAGLAHEINNPINFIYGNLTYIQEHTEDILYLLSAYQSQYPQPPESLQVELENLEFDFLKEDLHNILKSMKVGAERIQQIILSLRNFSRLDESEYKEVNLHEGIDNTLMLLQYQIRANAERPAIEIVKQYGEISLVECCPRDINQVFMNLLLNAIYALEESNQNRSFQEITTNPNRICISTKKTEQNQVQISIADNGVGIPEEIKLRLFDPFFTTKPVGKGTGLGLAIARQIVVDKHYGQIAVTSEVGRGTVFTLILPVRGV